MPSAVRRWAPVLLIVAAAVASCAACGCFGQAKSAREPMTEVRRPPGAAPAKGKGADTSAGKGAKPAAQPGPKGQGAAGAAPKAARANSGWWAFWLWVGTLAALLVAGLVYLLSLRPRWRTGDVVRRWDGSARSARIEIGRLGGAERSARRLDRYAKLPEHRAPNRLGAVLLLGFCGKAALEPLARRLHDENPMVRGHAAAALGLAGDRGAFEALYPAVADESPEVRMGAAWALGRLGDERALMPLVARLGDRDAAVRRAAAGALAELGDRRAAPPLETAAAGDPDSEVRAAARSALGRLHPTDIA